MAQNIRVMIVEDNLQLAESIRSFFVKKNAIEVSGIAFNSLEAIEMLKTTRPDIILMDLVMPRSDGFVLLEHLNTWEHEKKPEVIVISSLSHEVIIKRACELGAIYYMVKPFSMEDLHERVLHILGIRSVERTPAAPKISHTLDQRISSLFLKIGIPPQNKGYQYLNEAVKMAIAKPELVSSITKQLYPSVGKVFNTSPVNVERAIRHAIESAWESGRLQNINEIFKCTVFSPSYKPANGEFISIVSTKFLNSQD